MLLEGLKTLGMDFAVGIIKQLTTVRDSNSPLVVCDPAVLGNGYDPEYLKKAVSIATNPAFDREIQFAMQRILYAMPRCETLEDLKALRMSYEAIQSLWERMRGLHELAKEEIDLNSSSASSEDNDEDEML